MAALLHIRSNCTLLELKRRRARILRIRIKSSNCTLLELKPISMDSLKLNTPTVLIVPYWN